MGLFGAIAGGLGIISSIFGDGDKKQTQAIDRSAQTQAQAAQAAINEQRRQFDLSRGDMLPWLETGKEALGGQSDLLGLNGASPQAMAIAALKDSPLFKSLYGAGEEAILANASATGGLRGGNVQRSLADFGGDTLAQVIQQQLMNLGGLSSNGSTTGTNLGTLGSANAGAISQLMQQQGAATAGGIIGKAGIQAANQNNLFSSLGMFLGNGGIKQVGNLIGKLF